MTTWLKLIGSAERHCPEPYDRPYVDFSRQPRQIRDGDQLVFYAVGRGMRVFALARVKGDFYASGQERWPYRVDVEYSVNLWPSNGVHIDRVSTTERDLRLSIRQATYIRLTADEYAQAETRLRERERELAAGGGSSQAQPAAAH